MNSKTFSILALSLLIQLFGHTAEAQEASKCRGSLEKDLKSVLAQKSLVVNCTINSADSMPSMPSAIKGFEYQRNADYWGTKFKDEAELRVFDGGESQSLLDCTSDPAGCIQFPATQNACNSGIFILRWRSMTPEVRIAVTTVYGGYGGYVNKDWKVGEKGYLIGTNCHAPLFKFHSVSNSEGSTLADIRVDVRMWHPGVDDPN